MNQIGAGVDGMGGFLSMSGVDHPFEMVSLVGATTTALFLGLMVPSVLLLWIYRLIMMRIRAKSH